MSNHLEDLTAEWLEYNGYFVRKAVLVDKRFNGGFNGELDVVAFHPSSNHLLHVECSLDAHRWEVREERFQRKFEIGRRFIPDIFHGLRDLDEPDQVALLQLGGGDRVSVGGGRLLWVSDFISDIISDLAWRNPAKDVVPSTFPLLRTLQLAAVPVRGRKNSNRLFGQRID